jgi:hypothetical protein
VSQLQDHHVYVPLVRYSDGGSQNELSNESQLFEITRHVEREHPTAVAPFHLQDADSGRKANRNQLLDGIRKIKEYNRRASQPITLVLVHDWERFIRNTLYGVTWVVQFQEAGVEVNSISNWIHFSDRWSLMNFFYSLLEAQGYSDKLSDNTKRGQAQHLRDGYLPYRVGTRYLKADTKARTHHWLPAADNLRRAGQQIAAGKTLAGAYADNGGRDVLGAEQTFSDQLRKEYLMARYQGHELNYSPLWTEATWMKLQDVLRQTAPLTTKQRRLAKFFLRGLVFGAPCYRPSSSSSVRSRSGKRHHYLICTCKGVRHYRFRWADVVEDHRELMHELVLVGERQHRLVRKARQRSARQVAELKKSIRRLRARVKEQAETEANAVRLLARGVFTPEDRKVIQADGARLRVELDQAESVLAHHGEILAEVERSIAHIGVSFYEGADPLQLRDFTAMMFPDGLLYNPKTRTFRTTSPNAALSLTDAKSTAYAKIKFGLPHAVEGSPGMGGRPGHIRTPHSDLAAVRAYTVKYNLTA